jgi:hypothetical protein
MKNPSVIGRDEYAAIDDSGAVAADDLDERAGTNLISTVSIPFEAGAIGTLRVQVFSSMDDEDRGGVVLRITMENDASAFTPYSRNIENGVEVHMAGDAEGKALVNALKESVQNCQD